MNAVITTTSTGMFGLPDNLAYAFARWFLAVTPGYQSPSEGTPTVEEIARHWAEINDQAGYYVPGECGAPVRGEPWRR